ncbi:TolC family protein [Alkalimonas sp. NCh-2]|uniref:TolC family protein n=1 Tax=Alkalimonas sp. NCh-2 TaxID=3144846 RepID=UPI0031F5FC0E
MHFRSSLAGLTAMLLFLMPDSTLRATTLSLPDAEQRLASNRTLLAQQADVDAWQAQQRALNSLNLPQLSITIAGIAYEKEVTFDIPVINQPAELDVFRSGIRSQMNLLWPLYTGGRTNAAQQQVAARVTEAEAEQRLLQLQLLKRLFDLYFSSQMMQQVVQVREQALQTLDAHVHKARRFEQEGLITQLNRMQAEVAQAEARRSAVQARRQLIDVQAALQNLLQLDALSCLSTPLPQPVALTESIDWFVAEARRNNPVFSQLQAKDRQVKQQLRIEQGKKLPEVFLVGSYDLNRAATPLTEPDWSIGLGMRYHFTTPVNRQASVDAVLSRQQQLDHSRDQADADMQLAVESSYRTVLQHLEQFELLQQDLELAREHARLQRHAFEEGMATSLDVTDARLKQAAAEVEALQAAFQYSSALAQLTQLTGRPELLANWLPALLQQQSCASI